MSTTAHKLSVRCLRADKTPIPGAKVTATITHTDYTADGVLLPDQRSATADEDGLAELHLVSNRVGTQSSLYLIEIFDPETDRLINPRPPRIEMPEGDSDLGQLVGKKPSTEATQTAAALSAAESKKWATGTEPGGAGTQSSREWAELSVNAPAVLVAASDAPDDIKRVAAYVCDGVEDHIEIENAIDSLPVGGGVVSLSAGNFSGWVQVKRQRVTLRGAGWGTRVTVPGTIVNEEASPIRVLADYVTISDLHIDGNQSAMGSNDEDFNDGIGVYANFCNIMNVWVDNCLSHGIIIWNRTSELDGIKEEARIGCNITNNLVTNTTASAIDIAAGWPENEDAISKENVVSGNVCRGGGDAGITMHTAGRVVISGNTISEKDEGINAHTSSRDLVIASNYIEDVENRGIRFTGERATITGNIVQSAGGNGIEVINSSNVEIVGGIIVSAGDFGCRIQGSSDVSVSSSQFITSVNSSVLVSSSDNCLVSGCRLVNSGNHGTSVVESSDTVISNCKIVGTVNRGISTSNLSGLFSVMDCDIAPGSIEAIEIINGGAEKTIITGNNIFGRVRVTVNGLAIISENMIDMGSNTTENAVLVQAGNVVDAVEICSNHVKGGSHGIYTFAPRVRIAGGSIQGTVNPGVRIADDDVTVSEVTIRDMDTGVRWNSTDLARQSLLGCRFLGVASATHTEPTELIKANNHGI